MTNEELLTVSIIGTIAFYLVTGYIRKSVTGTTNELKIRKNIKTISIIYGILMAIQIISLIVGLPGDEM